VAQTWRMQEKLRGIQKDKSAQLLFGSNAKGGTEDKVQSLTLATKEAIQQI